MKAKVAGLLPVRALRRFLAAQGPNWATIIAWNLFFAFFPMVFLAISAVGFALRDPGTRATVVQQVLAAFPSCNAQQSSGGDCQIVTALNDFRHSSGLFAVIGIVGLIWSGSSLFGAIEQGLNSLYGCASRGFVRGKVMAIGMVAIFTVMAVPLVASGSLLGLLRSIPGVPDFLRGGPASVLLQVGAGVVDASLLFGVIFFVVPNRHQRVRDVLPGAVAAGVIFEGLTLLFPLYFGLVTHSPQWGQTFGFIFVLLFYFFLIGQIVMVGGAVNAEIAAAHHPGEASEAKATLGRREAVAAAEAPETG
ncbi:MAG: YihY/virulence factor BrkB family protein [Candidatus Dormibacter sp.]